MDEKVCKFIKISDEEWPIRKISDGHLGSGYELDFTEMYEPPDITYKLLSVVSEFFGTDEIDIDNMSRRGCESCDYGSRYGAEVQVYKITKEIDFDSLEDCTDGF